MSSARSNSGRPGQEQHQHQRSFKERERERAENENEKERDLLQPVGAPLVNDPAEVNAVLADRDVAQPRGSRIGLVNETQVTKQPAEGR